MTRYPVLLLHGMGFRDRKHFCYWGRLARLLRKNGADVYFGYQDSNGSIESNARLIERAALCALENSGAQKLNIIAHSKGGLEARYLISSMGWGDRIASLTTLSTPHNGSKTVDALLPILPEGVIRACCKAVDLWFRLLGDRSPDTFAAICSFRTADAQRFNEANPDDPRVYYQSAGFVMKSARADMLMWLTYLCVRHFEGDNDGLLAPRAVMWTNYLGTFTGTGKRGISHCDETDLRRLPLAKKPPNADNEISDITEFYLGLVKQLGEMGL